MFYSCRVNCCLLFKTILCQYACKGKPPLDQQPNLLKQIKVPLGSNLFCPFRTVVGNTETPEALSRRDRFGKTPWLRFTVLEHSTRRGEPVKLVVRTVVLTGCHQADKVT